MFLIVYDITKRASFLGIQKWIEEVRRYTASNVMLVLIGNKCDLESDREVSKHFQTSITILTTFERSSLPRPKPCVSSFQRLCS